MGDIKQAIKDQLKSCLSLTGRDNRRTYFANILMITAFTLYGDLFIHARTHSTLVISFGWILGILGLIWEFFATARRAHDFGQFIWVPFLLTFFNIGSIWVVKMSYLAFFCRLIILLIPGDSSANKYGDKPESKIII